MPKSNHYCFTLNNWTNDHYDIISNLVSSWNFISYVICGKEIGENGTPHLQGYLQLTGRKDWRALKSKIGIQSIHLEACKGNGKQNFEYCSKDGDFDQWGEIDEERGRTRSNPRNNAGTDILHKIKAGASMQEIVEQFPEEWIKHHTGITSMFKIMTIPRFEPKFGPFTWKIAIPHDKSLHLWGAPGIGKTCYAQYLLPKALFVSHMDQLRGYNPNDYDGIIFDDMSFGHMPREAQIHIVDREQMRAIHVRYGCANLPAGTKKIFLSNISDIFDYSDGAISRRVHKVYLE